MPSLVTRFHLLIFSVTLAITAVALLRVPEGFAFVAHWRGSVADWLWPRDMALAVAPLLEIGLLVAFFVLGRVLTKNHLAKTRHIFDPALTLLLAVPAFCQLGLLFSGIGSDLDLIRFAGFGLGFVLMLLGIVLYGAERNSYGGLRMPWPIPSDRAWLVVHRLTGAATFLAGAGLAVLAWIDPGLGVLLLAYGLSLLVLPVLAGLVSLLSRPL
ncbi:SdpI family protein [Devosia sp. FJ2-5-3]|uniref:SdpI family protein n=1 Tax=Devosia sp. FJ2-5-3 TaxID=2976680 RepID=UPI0023D8C0CB|nr:SdpI family protein [Devosia sp. FJ2-5-3]WEJ57292.1 SdpI family protein [Devosia sp. FJ2-5-3]